MLKCDNNIEHFLILRQTSGYLDISEKCRDIKGSLLLSKFLQK